MTRNENQLTSLPFYTDTKYQDKNKWWVQSVYKLVSPNDKFLPFQIIKDITSVGGVTCPVPSSIDYTADFSTTIDGWYVEVFEGDINTTISHDGNRVKVDVVNNTPGIAYEFSLNKIVSTDRYRYSAGTVNTTVRGSSADCKLAAFTMPGAFWIFPANTIIQSGYTFVDTVNEDNYTNLTKIFFQNSTGDNESFYLESFTSSSAPYQLLNDNEVYQSIFAIGDTDSWSIVSSGSSTLAGQAGSALITYNGDETTTISRAISDTNTSVIVEYTITITANQGIISSMLLFAVKTNDLSLIRGINNINHDFSLNNTYEYNTTNIDEIKTFTNLQIIMLPNEELSTEISSISIDTLIECSEQQADIWTEAELINYKTGAIEDISTYMEANTTLSTYSDYQVAIYDASVSLIADIVPGLYYLRLNDGQDNYYSEIFIPCADLSEYIKIEWWRDSDLIFNNQDGNARIVYSTGFINIMYLPEDIGKPQYIYEVTEKSRSGYKFVEKVVSFKRFAFDGIVPEMIVDVLSRLPHHEYILITSNDISYRPTKIEIKEADWTDYGDLAVLPIEFETYTVISSGTNVNGTVNELFSNDTEAINIRGNNKRIYQLNDTSDLEDLFIAADKSTLSESVRLSLKETIQQYAIAEPVPKIDFDPQDEPQDYQIARIFYDAVENVWTAYNDIEGVALQIGEELWGRLINDTGGGLLDGKAISVTGASGVNLTVELLDASSIDSVRRSFGLITLTASNGEVTYGARYGAVRNLDTSAFSDGDVIYVDPATPGDLTNIRPNAPFYPVRIGICLLSDATIGIIGVDTVPFTGSDTSINIEGTLNGIVINTPEVNFYESGGNIFVEILNEEDNAKNLSFIIDGVRYNLNTTTGSGPNGGASAQLATGADSETLFENYIYIWLDGGTPTLKAATLSTSDTLAEIGKASLFNYTRTVAEGVYKFRRSNNAPDNGADDGFNNWTLAAIRDKLGTTYTSGIDATVNVDSTPSITISTTAGVAMQVHKSTFTAQDGTLYWIYNDNTNTVTYEQVSDLADITETATGLSLAGNGRYYRLRVLGMQNSSSGGGLAVSDKLIITRPLGYYGSSAEAIVDANNFDVAINDIITEGVIFNLYTLVIGRTGGGGGTWTLIETQDNRSRLIGGVGGGGAQSGAGSDVNVAITSLDTTPSYLNDKLTVSGGLSKSTTNPGANEQLDIQLPATVTKAVQNFSGQAHGGNNTATFSTTTTFFADDGNNQLVSITGDTTIEISDELPGTFVLTLLINTATPPIITIGTTLGSSADGNPNLSTANGDRNIITILVAPDAVKVYTIITLTA